MITSHLCAKQCFSYFFPIMDQCERARVGLCVASPRVKHQKTRWFHPCGFYCRLKSKGKKTVQGLLMLKCCYNKYILVLKCLCSLFQRGSIISYQLRPLIQLFSLSLECKSVTEVLQIIYPLNNSYMYNISCLCSILFLFGSSSALAAVLTVAHFMMLIFSIFITWSFLQISLVTIITFPFSSVVGGFENPWKVQLFVTDLQLNSTKLSEMSEMLMETELWCSVLFSLTPFRTTYLQGYRHFKSNCQKYENSEYYSINVVVLTSNLKNKTSTKDCKLAKI